jgi:hypothetical protein
MKPPIKKGEIKRGKRQEIEFQSEESLLDRIEKELIEDGFLKFSNDSTDSEYLTLPFHLDEVAPREITRYLHAYTQQRVYIRSWLSRVNILLLEAESDLDREKIRVYASVPSAVKSVSEKELYLYDDEKCSLILDILKELRSKQIMLADQIKNIEEIIFDISRELSRRGIDLGAHNREENVNSQRR